MPHDSDTGSSRRYVRLMGAVLMLVGIGTALVLWWPDIAFQTGIIKAAIPYPNRFDASADSDSAIPADDRLVIPRIALDVPVFEGDANTALAEGLYHYPETASPGESGNAVIAGHRIARAFALLHRLEPGDAVVLYWLGQEYDYRVVSVREVGADATGILTRGDAEKLTLYTCTPRFLGNKRTVVIAEPVTP